MIKEYKHEIPIYKYDFNVVIFQEDVEFDKWASKNKLEVDMSVYGAIVCSRDRLSVAIFREEDLSNGLIAHEAKHVVNEIFKCIGQKLDVNNDEVEAYLLQYVFDVIEKDVNKFKG